VRGLLKALTRKTPRLQWGSNLRAIDYKFGLLSTELSWNVACSIEQPVNGISNRTMCNERHLVQERLIIKVLRPSPVDFSSVVVPGIKYDGLSIEIWNNFLVGVYLTGDQFTFFTLLGSLTEPVQNDSMIEFGSRPIVSLTSKLCRIT